MDFQGLFQERDGKWRITVVIVRYLIEIWPPLWEYQYSTFHVRLPDG